MAASEDRASSGVLEASNAAGRSIWAVFVSFVSVWARAVCAMPVQRLTDWTHRDKIGSELASMSERDLRDLGIDRIDIAAICAGTYKRGSSDTAERIVFCPEAGKPVGAKEEPTSTASSARK